ncbi:Uncharacterised protein [Yersinia frederiksenii]|nr:Uncharacterised protein [Yersinia frederiksenii]
MLVRRNITGIVLQRKGQQATSQTRQFTPEQFRMTPWGLQKFSENRLGTVQGIEQPEQGDIRDRKVSHPLITLTAHGHQTLTSCLQTNQQITQFSGQQRARRNGKHRRNESRVPAPFPLCITHQTGDRTGQVCGIFLSGQTQCDGITQNGQFTAFMPGQFLHHHTFRFPATRPLTVLAVIKVATAGAQQRQRDNHVNSFTALCCGQITD